MHTPALSDDTAPATRHTRRERRTGVEVEFLGPSARAAAAAIAAGLGGTLEKEDPHAFRVSGSRLGELRVETDLRAVHPRRHPELAFRLDDRSADWLGSLVQPFVPREFITGPLPFHRLAEVDDAVACLHAAGARGEGTILFDTLGLHFNVDPPDETVATLVAYLRAFLVLEQEMRLACAEGREDALAALTACFPSSYARLVLSPDYDPDAAGIARDYLSANPTRRRGLDLLPLLAHLDPEGVRAVLPREKISARPVFHYRLPLAHAGVPGWSIMPAWETWLRVENLAADCDELARRSRALLAA